MASSLERLEAKYQSLKAELNEIGFISPGSLVVREGRDSCGSAYVTGAGGRLLAVLYDSALSVMAVAKALLADPAPRA